MDAVARHVIANEIPPSAFTALLVDRAESPSQLWLARPSRPSSCHWRHSPVGVLRLGRLESADMGTLYMLGIRQLILRPLRVDLPSENHF